MCILRIIKKKKKKKKRHQSIDMTVNKPVWSTQDASLPIGKVNTSQDGGGLANFWNLTFITKHFISSNWLVALYRAMMVNQLTDK